MLQYQLSDFLVKTTGEHCGGVPNAIGLFDNECTIILVIRYTMAYEKGNGYGCSCNLKSRVCKSYDDITNGDYEAGFRTVCLSGTISTRKY